MLKQFKREYLKSKVLVLRRPVFLVSPEGGRWRRLEVLNSLKFACFFLGYCVACGGNSLPTFRDQNVVPKDVYGNTIIRCVISQKRADPLMITTSHAPFTFEGEVEQATS